MKKLNPGYTLATIKKGSYPKQDSDVKVIGYATHIFVSCKLPADEVYKMTKAIVDNTSNLASIAKAIGKQDVAGFACRHRRAVPSGRGEVLQGTRHHRASH